MPIVIDDAEILYARSDEDCERFIDLKKRLHANLNNSHFTYTESPIFNDRQAVYFLQEAMRLFSQTHPDIQIVPKFKYENSMESFLNNDTDIVFALKEQIKKSQASTPGICLKARCI